MREHISYKTIANQIRMARSQEEGCFCLVEGSDDSKLYKRFLDKKKCHIVIAYGRENAEKALRELESDVGLHILAVIDADFDHLEGRPPPSRNAFFTDRHDLELLMLSTSAFEKLLCEFTSDEKMKAQPHSDDLRSKLLDASSSLGCLRWFSLRENLALSFENLKFGRFVVPATLTIDPSKLFEEIRNHSQRPDISDEFLSNGIQNLLDCNPDAWQVCCGHDVLEILSVCLRKTLASKDAGEVTLERLSSSLRLAYDRADFENTKLFGSLRAWEESNKPCVVLAASGSGPLLDFALNSA